MADKITTTADLVTYKVMPEADIERLQDDRMRSNQWDLEHKRAWRQTLKRLKLRSDRIEETDLDDSAELKEIVCYHVAGQAYQFGPTEEDQKTSKKLFADWARELEEIELSAFGGTLNPGSYQYQRVFRA